MPVAGQHLPHLRWVIGIITLSLFIGAGRSPWGEEGRLRPLTPQQVEELLWREDKSALPALRETFRQTTDRLVKLQTATVLVRLGDPERSYWAFLVQQASLAVESDMPSPFASDPQGQVVKGRLSQEFLNWCATKKVNCDAAAEEALFWMPNYVLILGVAADPRAFDLLMRGIGSKNPLIAAEAATGLARLQDKRAIRPIIEAARKTPADGRLAFARPLVFFDDPEAQKAAEELIPDKAVLAAIRKQALKGPKAVYGE